MSKKKSFGRKPSGTAGIKIVEDDREELRDEDPTTESDSAPTFDASNVEVRATRPPRAKKADTQTGDHVNVTDVRKAAAFANSVGGLDKAVALLQILKVAKEVQ